MENITHKDVLDLLHAMMDGREWDACGLCEELAYQMAKLGYVIREPQDTDDE